MRIERICSLAVLTLLTVNVKVLPVVFRPASFSATDAFATTASVKVVLATPDDSPVAVTV